MAHVILGFLLISPMSFYDLIKAFEASVSFFYSASAGSIKRALDGLLAQGHIETADAEPGTRGRKTYRITESGRRAFGEWMNAEPSAPDLETAALSRLFFLGHLPPAERPPVLERILERIEGELATFAALGRQIDGIAVADEHRELAVYQRAALDYGLSALRGARSWFRDLLERERRGS